MMDNKRRFFHGIFLKIDIDKIISIHENTYIERPEYFLYIEGISEKVVLCENDYNELCNIICDTTDDIENILASDEDNDTSNASSNVNKLNMF